MRIIDLMLKDLLQWIRDWKAALFLLVMPVLFTLLFGFAFGGFSGGDDPRIPLAFLDEDQGRFSETILDLFSKSQAFRLDVFEEMSRSDLSQRVDKGDYPAALIVPSGYSQALENNEPAALILIADSTSPNASALEQLIGSSVGRLQTAVQAARLSEVVYVQQAGGADTAAIFDSALQRALQAWEQPPVEIEILSAQPSTAGQDDVYGDNAFTHSSPGMMLQFSIAGLIGAAEIMVLERRSRSLQRLMTTPIPRFGILLGHFLAMVIMILFQLLILTTFGDLALRLTYWQAPLATGLILVSTALFVASMGLMIGVFAKTPEQSIIFSLLPMFVLAGLGGAWVPLELTGKAFQTIGHLTPLAWALDGMKNIILRGLGLESVLLPAGILLAYAVVFFGLAFWKFNTIQES